MPKRICQTCLAIGQAVQAERARGRPGVPTTQREMAVRLEINRAMLSNRETGQLHWDVCEVVAAAELLHVPVSALIEGEESADVPSPADTLAALQTLGRALRGS